LLLPAAVDDLLVGVVEEQSQGVLDAGVVVYTGCCFLVFLADAAVEVVPLGAALAVLSVFSAAGDEFLVLLILFFLFFFCFFLFFFGGGFLFCSYLVVPLDAALAVLSVFCAAGDEFFFCRSCCCGRNGRWRIFYFPNRCCC
jgi:hypothetical protein